VAAAPTWGSPLREEARLCAADESLLDLIARLPLVPARCLVPLSPVGSSASLYRHLAELVHRGLVNTLAGPPERGGRRRALLLVDNTGLAVLAYRRGVEVAALARHRALHRTALDRLVLQLPIALASYELLALLARARGAGVRLSGWSRPWRWAGAALAAPGQRRLRAAVLPAYASLDWISARDGQVRAGYVLVADTGGLSPRSLRPHLLRLAHLLHAAGQAGPCVAIATTSPRRVGAWQLLLDEIAWSRHGGPLTARVATWDVWRSGQAAPPPAHRSTESPVVLAGLRPEQQRRPWVSLPRPIDAERLRAAVAVWELGAAARAALDVVGRHPFLPTSALGQVLGRDVRWARERRAELVQRGLVRVVPTEELPMTGVGRVDALLESTARGLGLLASFLGLTLAAAVRYHGLAGGGPRTPVGSRRALLRHLQHTLGTDALFVSLAHTTYGHRDGTLVEWRNAAACASGRLRPDGYGVLRLGRREYGFFVEFDRGSMRPGRLRAKFAAYHRYRASARVRRDYDGFPRVLVVTTEPGAEERLARAIQAADAGQAAALPAFLTTTGLLANAPGGPLGRVWRTAADPARRLLWP
jgi:hypothetical protein